MLIEKVAFAPNQNFVGKDLRTKEMLVYSDKGKPLTVHGATIILPSATSVKSDGILVSHYEVGEYEYYNGILHLIGTRIDMPYATEEFDYFQFKKSSYASIPPTM